MYVWARAGAVAKNVAVNKIAKAEMRIRASVGVASGEREDLPRKGHSPSHYCRFDGPGPSCIMFTAKQEPIRRAEIGVHHHIAGAYLLRYAQESSWREDNRRVSNGDQVNRVAALAMKRGKSVDFTGYWQRHIAS